MAYIGRRTSSPGSVPRFDLGYHGILTAFNTTKLDGRNKMAIVFPVRLRGGWKYHPNTGDVPHVQPVFRGSRNRRRAHGSLRGNLL